jgi:menaquinone-dependent protoporphyrinogen oxidase
MKPFVVLYATREGQTRRIAEHIAATLRARGRATDVVDVHNLPDWFDLARFDGAIVAASVHLGKHEPEMVSFVKRQHAALEQMPAAFLSVSLTEAAVEDPASTADARRKAEDEVRATISAFLAETGWHPSRVRAVAGALLYTKYNLIVRLVMKFVSKRSGASTDTTRDFEYTDWAALDRFIDETLARTERASVGRETAPPPVASR